MSGFRAQVWLSQIDAAKCLGVTTRTIRRWLSSPWGRRKLGAIRSAGRWRIPIKARWYQARMEDLRLRTLWHRYPSQPETVARISRSERRQIRKEICELVKDDEQQWSEWMGAATLWAYIYLVSSRTGQGVLAAAEVDELLRFFAHCAAADSPQAAQSNLPEDLRRLWPPSKMLLFGRGRTQAANLAQLEKCRREWQFREAVELLSRSESKRPRTHEIRALIHPDWRNQLNAIDRATDRNALRRLPGENPRCLSLREFRRRYPLTESPWKEILARTYVPSAFSGAVAPLKNGRPIETMDDDCERT